MSLTPDQVLALAPDASSVAAGRKAANPRDWSAAGHDDRALWGKCQGSAVYTVLVDLSDNASKCSCPSRKFPCKHALGLLLLHAMGAVNAATPPDDVATWIAGRTTRAAKKADVSSAPVDAEAALARQVKRLDGMGDGVATMQRWLADLVRDGLATVEANTPWERQAARLVDAKAAGLAGRVRGLAEHVGGNDDWPARLLDELGLLALLGRAVAAHGTLPPELAIEVRTLAGVPYAADDVLRAGERVADDWWIVGQTEEDDGRLRSQRSWLVGTNTGTVALVLQFAPGSQPFATALAAGQGFAGTLAFFPEGERALVVERTGKPSGAPTLRGPDRIERLYDDLAGALARRPWLSSRAAILRDVVPVRDSAGFWLVDAEGGALAVLGGTAMWMLLALSGGHPVDIAVEWGPDFVTLLSVRDGDQLVPLRASSDDGGA
ncbi:MAG: SWIM zinc finger family protein [Myxococcota bacterium]